MGGAKEGAGRGAHQWEGGMNDTQTSVVYVLFGFIFIIFYIVIAVVTLKNKMKHKKKNEEIGV